MEAEPMDSSAAPAARAPDVHPSAPANSVPANATKDGSSKLSASGLTSWAKGLKLPQTSAGRQDKSTGENSAKSAFARFTSGVGLHLSPRETPDQGVDGAQPQSNFFENFTKGIVDSSKSAVRAVSVKARHVVSQNKRRYQEDGFDLDMTYITENIIAMGFPAGDMSSGFFGYMEGFYRNHMEEVIRFLESRHKGRYKVYNLCSERLYDASLFEGKLASFPFEDHNCPPIQLIISFCQSAYSWLKEDIENVVVVHCKAGMARTGLMISSLLLYLKFFPTAEESIDYYNQKRCFDAKALVLPSQIRYVKYFERTLTYFNGENQPGRRCLLRGFRLHRCPYWIRPHITVSDHSGILFSTKKHPRTKDLSPEEFWFSAPKKGIMVFALPGEPGLTELAGDFKVHFHDRQGDFYFWLNTTMIENRKTLNTSDMDGFDKRKLPSPGFQVEVVLVDYDANASATPKPEETGAPRTNEQPVSSPAPVDGTSPAPDPNQDKQNPHKDESPDRDDVFSDSENEGSGPSKTRKSKQATSSVVRTITEPPPSGGSDQVESLTHKTEQVSLGKGNPAEDKKEKSATEAGSVLSSEGVSEFKVMAADASVFTFGDEDDYESD